MSDNDHNEATPSEQKNKKPETANIPASSLDLENYRKQRREQLLKEVQSITNLKPNVSSRVFTYIVNGAVNKAFC